MAAVHHELDAAGSPDGPRIALVTLGCDKNTVDSERMMAALLGHGAHVSSDVDGADVVIVNTCGFIQEAKEQSIETILEACDLKERGLLKAVVAVGCLVQRYKQDLEEEIPEVDLFMGLTELQGLVPELRSRGLLPEPDPVPSGGAQAVPIMERPLRVLSTETRHTSYLKISEGCDHTCAFCAIPLMRGLHRSQPVEELVREAAGLGAQGVREINIISQDTTWYGRDVRRRDREAPLLPELMRALLDRQRDSLACMQRGERRLEAGRSDDRVHDDVHIGLRRRFDQAIRAATAVHSRARRGSPRAVPVDQPPEPSTRFDTNLFQLVCRTARRDGHD